MWEGRLFHLFGAATAKARSPLCLYFVLLTIKIEWSEDLKDLAGLCTSRSSDRKEGANPFKAGFFSLLPDGSRLKKLCVGWVGSPAMQRALRVRRVL